MTDTALQISGLSKRFGAVTAVEDLTFGVRRGRVSGFLGLNGAGKRTTLRMLLGLVRPDSGTARVAGRPSPRLQDPARTVGAVLEIAHARPRTNARDHLRTCSALAGLDRARIDTAMSETGVERFTDRRVGTLSTCMRQPLAVATALLGNPGILILDEPTTGLDPSGIAWLRRFLRLFADRGGTALVSIHALLEVAATVDDIVIIDRGRLRFSGPMRELGDIDDDLESAHLRLTQAGAVP